MALSDAAEGGVSAEIATMQDLFGEDCGEVAEVGTEPQSVTPHSEGGVGAVTATMLDGEDGGEVAEVGTVPEPVTPRPCKRIGEEFDGSQWKTPKLAVARRQGMRW